jgi:hypothetical protein
MPAMDEAREHAIATLRRTIAILHRVIAKNEQLARDFPSRRDSAQKRIIEGEQEIATAEAEVAALERGEMLSPHDRT